MRSRAWGRSNEIAFLTGTGGYIGPVQGGVQYPTTTPMNTQDSRTLAERLYSKSFEAFLEDIPTAIKKGKVMQICLNSFKNRLDREAAAEMNAFKISYDAASSLIFQKDCEISDLEDKVKALETKNEKLKEKLRGIQVYHASHYGELDECWDNINYLEEKVERLQNRIEEQDKLAEKQMKEKQKLTKKLQEFEESAAKLKRQKKNEFRVLFPSLTFNQ